MSDNAISARELSALTLAVAIAFDGALKPRSASQAQMIRDDAKAAIAKLRAAK